VGSLQVSVSTEGRGGGCCALVSLAGQAGIADCMWLRHLLELQTSRGPARMVVDLSRLSAMDWWVALMLSWAARVVSRRGGTLMLAAPQPAVTDMLKSADTEQIMPIYRSVRAATATCPYQCRTAG
jgi:anti-anti-sigma regulatory factor